MLINAKDKKHLSNNDLIEINIDLATFNIWCRYVISSSSYIRIAHLLNLRKLINNLDKRMYENDPEKVKRVQFIKKGLEARIDYNLTSKDLILNHIMTGLTFDVDFIDPFADEPTSDEILWMHRNISTTLQYRFLYSEVDNVIDVFTRLKTTDYSKRDTVIDEIRSTVDTLKNLFRATDHDNSLTDMTFSLQENEFVKSVTDTYNLITNPSRRLICGMQGLNEMVGGGFESGRVYMLLGLTGIGKSISLLNLIYQIKRYNKKYKPKDPTKIPCIVLLTMENTVVETITRLFDLVTNGNESMGAYTVDEVLSKLRTEGELVVNDDSPIDIVIKYKANRSVDTSYLYTLCDDLEDLGYEVICLVQDHVKRIRSVFNIQDLRIELGEIVNEFKVFAAAKDIPVLTNCHLNRDAAKVIEEGTDKKKKKDLTMKLGKSNVGESLLMMDNIDCGIIINLDYDEQGNKYMVYSLIKMRDKTKRTYIAQPFMYGSGIRMVEDVGTIPMFKESLHTANSDINNNTNVMNSSSNILSNLNIFSNNNQLSSMNTFGSDNTYFIPSEEEEEEDNGYVLDEAPTIIRPFTFLPEEEENMENSLLNITELLNKKNAVG